ncbi:MAG: hypothetical protein BA871_15440 [Desulfuromonadales bacterium C00003096]|jgi:hypothetical protein|nr:MAG: hypothetical protein BA871_15440 [Desulfuromonadales bacterium C00003096]
MNYTEFIDFIKARWRMIAISIVVGLVVILTIYYVVGLFALPAEMASSSGVTTYNNSTEITETLSGTRFGA